MSWGDTVGGIFDPTSREVAFDLGWCDAFEGREIRDARTWDKTDARAYHEGYALGERERGREIGERRPPSPAYADAVKVLHQVERKRTTRYVAGIVLAAVVVIVLVVGPWWSVGS
jgi:hypothetical protein